MLDVFDIPLDVRAREGVSLAQVDELLDYYGENPPGFSPVELAWDLRRQFPDDGFALFLQLMEEHEPYEPIAVVEHDPQPSSAKATWDAYVSEVWASVDRAGPTQFDVLLVDELQWAQRKDAEMAEWDRRIEAFRLHRLTPESASMFGPTLSIVPAAPMPDLIKTSGEFVSGFVPPDYLIDGILQRRFCYSLTAQTGVGKTAVAMLISALVSTGSNLGEFDVEKGSVLYFAGENPTDVQTRWLGLTYALRIDPNAADVHFVPGARPLSQIAEAITAEIARKALNPSLVVVDTAAAYFEGDEENSNTQLGAFARQLRSLTLLPGGPCVLILCHPTKRATDDDLIPRGGGAFLAEVDGNIALVKKESVLLATAQGKFRGSDAWSLRFELDVVRNHPQLKDTRGRQIPTVIAKPISESMAGALEKSGERDEDIVLRTAPTRSEPGKTSTDIARKLQWFIKNDPAQPAHTKVSRVLGKLKSGKLVEESRGRWRLTAKGEQELNHMDAAARASVVPPQQPT